MLDMKKSEVTEDFHGTKVADPYRWLETADSQETKDWGEDQQKKCKEYFSTSEIKSVDKSRLTELFDYDKFFVPKKVNDSLFYLKNDGLQNQAILYVENKNGTKLVIDPNKLSEDGTVAMTNYAIREDEKLIAYAVSESGSDWQTIKVRDIETTEDLVDTIQWVKFTNIVWSPDGSGFFYGRFPEPGTVATEDESNHHKIFFHKIGTDQREDQLIHEQPEDKELMFWPFLTEDDQYLCLNVRLGTAPENRFYYKRFGSTEPFTRLLDDQDAEYSYITNDGTTFYFKTDLDSPKGRIVAIDLTNPNRNNWQEIIPEQENVISAVKWINDQFVTIYMKDAHHQIYFYKKDGTLTQQLELPIIGSLTEITGKGKSTEMYFGMTSFLTPTSIYKYDFNSRDLETIQESNMSIDVSQFKTTQVFYESKDGTKVPMFITHKRGLSLDSNNPVILYGYGGFNISLTPSFNPAILRWLEKGGVYAVANLRGGSEYGEAWHKAGMLERKQNVFDDFISAGEWLITNKYTRPSKLSIMGGSNGGLLVSACMVQRPDLFGAVICRVPVIDMLRYHKFTIGRYWIPEYGNAEKNPEHFKFMFAYSPLHNIKEGQKYPPVLIATADTDDRVVPAHAKKFAATLQEKASADSKVILRLETKAGHGLGKPTSKVIDEWVDFYSFLDKELY